MTTSLPYSNAGDSHVSTLECLRDCLLDNMFLFCRNKLILIFILIILFAAFNIECKVYKGLDNVAIDNVEMYSQIKYNTQAYNILNALHYI